MSIKHDEKKPTANEASSQKAETKTTRVQITSVSSSYGMQLPGRILSYSVDASAKNSQKK